MIFSSLANAPGKLEYDVAIYGAGPAGITLALELSKSGISVGLFEAGEESAPPMNADHPYNAENVGRPYNLSYTRLRYLGGTSNHWGGWCRPLDSYDFEERPFVPVTGWPINRSELNPYYERALKVCEIPTAGLGMAAFEHDFGYDKFNHKLNNDLCVKNFLFSPPTRFGKRYKDDLDKAENVYCFLDSTLIKLSSDSGSISAVEVGRKTGERYTVRASFHVVAMGAAENARMLLHSNVCNSSDYVGRCFSDHLGKTIGYAAIDKKSRYYLHEATSESAPVSVLPHLAFKDKLYRENELVNFGMVLTPKAPKNPTTDELVRQTGFWSSSDASHCSMLVRMENIPNPNSALTLTNQKDPYGIPRLKLNWQPSPIDFMSVERIGALFTRQLGIAGGRVNITFANTEEIRNSATYQAHHLGTTRMSANPDDGVVDKNMQAHDQKNLFIAGSSVFPVFGFANPTLTIVALSIRLAEHIQSRMEQ